jgi:heterodisulfide reductase subunit B2
MKISFYPGCSLEGMANDYAMSVVAVFQALGIDLIEIDDWSCCGATAAHSLSETLSVALPARNLALAEKMGLDIVAPCANCFNRLRYSQQMVKKRIVDIPWDLTGDIRIHDITRFLAEPEMLRRVRERVLKPLKGLRVVCYYGCQMVRHPSITGFTDYENPRTLDLLVSAVGAESIDWSYKSTCCGASIGIGRKDIQQTLTRRILDKARQAGAEAVVVSCPLCQSNLDVFQKDLKGASLPVFYFTELLRLAFDEAAEARWFKQHLTNPVGLLQAKGFL